MAKYFKTFEELKIALTFGEGDTEFYDLVVNDLEKAMEYARNSRFSANPMVNVMNYQHRQHYMKFDDFLELLVCLKDHDPSGE